MDDDLPPPWISDLDLCRLIEKVTKQPATLADAKTWRKAIERERARRVRGRCRRPLLPRSVDDVSFTTFVLELLSSDEGRIMVNVLLCGGSLAADLLDKAARALYDRMRCQSAISQDARPNIEGLHVYAVEKSALHGRRCYTYPDPAHTLPGLTLAVLNVATSDALVSWRDRLFAARRSPAVRQSLLARLRSEGANVVRAYPELDIAHPMPGPSLALWPVPTTAPITSLPDPNASYVPLWAGRKL